MHSPSDHGHVVVLRSQKSKSNKFCFCKLLLYHEINDLKMKIRNNCEPGPAVTEQFCSLRLTVTQSVENDLFRKFFV